MGVAAVLGLVLAVSLALYDRGIVPIDEGLPVQGASEILHGRQLYRDTVLVYPPGYFYFAAGIFRLFGESLWVMRVVSIVLQIALSAVMWALVRKTSRSPLLAVLGVFLAKFAKLIVVGVAVAAAAVAKFLRGRSSGS